MTEPELNGFLEKLIKKNGGLPPDELAIFKKLIDLTLQFRDELLADHNRTLTVRETQVAITIYAKTLAEKRLPRTLDEIISCLVKLWLKEINNIIY
ncbi:MAG: hypothetical protein ABIJ45_10895 [Candidatus Zixiibacteriota bacterium]